MECSSEIANGLGVRHTPIYCASSAFEPASTDIHCNLWRHGASHPTCQSSYSSSTHVYSKIRKPTRVQFCGLPSPAVGAEGRCSLNAKAKMRSSLLANDRWALKNADVTTSAVTERVLEAGHQVDLFKVSVIDYHSHTQTHCLLESWHIQNFQTLLNRERGPCQDLCNPTGVTAALATHY